MQNTIQSDKISRYKPATVCYSTHQQTILDICYVLSKRRDSILKQSHTSTRFSKYGMDTTRHFLTKQNLTQSYMPWVKCGSKTVRQATFLRQQ